MNDSRKTKAELIDELRSLRDKVRQLEAGCLPAVSSGQMPQSADSADQALIFRSVVDNACAGIAVARIDGILVYSNDAYAAMHGFTAEEVMGQHLSIFHTPEQMPNANRIIQKIIRDGYISDTEMWHRRKDGSVFPTIMNVALLRDEQGQPAFLSATVIDVSARHETEQALIESEQRFRCLADSIDRVFWIASPDWQRFYYVSPASERILGLSAWELYDNPASLRDAFVEEDRSILRNRMDILTAGDFSEPCGPAIRIRRTDGDVRWIQSSAFPIRDDSGQVYRIAGIVEDVTDRKRIEEELQRVQYSLTEAQRIATMGNWDWHVAENTLWWSDEMHRIYGIPRSEFGGSYDDFINTVHPDDRDFVNEQLQLAFSGGKVFSAEFRLQFKDGTQKYIEAKGDVFTDAQGNVVRMIGTNHDVTEKRLADRVQAFKTALIVSMTEQDSLRGALGAAFSSIFELEEIDSGGVYLVDPHTGDVDLVDHRGLSESFVRKVKHYESQDVRVQMIMKGELICLPASLTPEDIRNELHEQGILVLVIIPIQVGARVIGTLNLASHTCETISTVTRRSLEAITQSDLGMIITRMKAIEDLRLSEENYRTIFNVTHDGIVIYDRMGRVLDCNEEACAMLGCSCEELMTASPEDSLLRDAPLSWAEFDRIISEVVEKGGRQLEWCATHKDGTKMWLDVVLKASLIRGELRILASARDITKRKVSEEALRESQEKYTRLLRSLPVMAYALDLKEQKYDVLEGDVERITGCRAEHLRENHRVLIHVTHPHDRERLLAELATVGAEGSNLETEFRIIRRNDGATVWGLLRAYHRRDETGQVRWRFGVLLDITARKRAEETVAQFAKAIENTGDGIGIWDDGGCITYANPAFARLLHFESAADLIGRDCTKLFDVRSLGLGESDEQRFRKGPLYQVSITGECRDGARVPLSATVVPLDPEDPHSPTLADIRDRTFDEVTIGRLKQRSADSTRTLEEERQHFSRELHDEFGQDLTALGMRMAMLRRRVFDDSPAIREQVEKSMELVAALQGKVHSLARSLRPAILDHGGVEDAVRSHVKDFEESTAIACEFSGPAQPMILDSDRSLAIYRIVQESLTNVAKHSNATRAWINLKGDSQQVEVTIRDNGAGAGKDKLVDPGGLGIAGMRDRIAELGGTLIADNCALGGFQVMVWMPSGRVREAHPHD